jgi:triacylglycerol lipase
MRVTVLIALSGMALGCAESAEPADEGTAQGPESKLEAAEAVDGGKADWAFDFCERRGWYSDGSCDWFCPSPDPDCALPPLFDAPSGVAAAYPIVLAHGFDASHSDSLVNRWAFYKVADTLRQDGHTVCTPTVPPYETAEERAKVLAEGLSACLQEHGATKVNIVAHSMAGLDARHAISQLGLADSVASLTTISTAHRGTYVADFALGVLPGVLDPIVDALASLWGRTYSELSDDSSVRGALTSLSKERSEVFNQENPNADGVLYQSWAGVSSMFGIQSYKRVLEACGGAARTFIYEGAADRMHLTIKPMAPLAAEGIANLVGDGMVSVESAKWGEFRGCIPADHMDEVGQYRNEGPNPHTGFDHLRFYRTLAYDLAARGF